MSLCILSYDMKVFYRIINMFQNKLKMTPKMVPKWPPKWTPNGPQNAPPEGPQNGPQNGPQSGGQKPRFSIGFTTKMKNPEPRGGKREWSAENNTSISDDPKKLMGLVALPIYFHALFIFIFLHAIFAR